MKVSPLLKEKERLFMEKEIVVSDYHEVAYLLLNHCQLVKIEGRTVNDRIVCEFTISGEEISQKHLLYLNGDAEANILNLRRMVNQIQIWAYSAKKKFKKQVGQQKQGCNEGVSL
jgi:hypothetical protein